MLASLDVPFVDTEPLALSLSIDLPPIDAVRTTRVDNGRFTVELRLLSASHQIVVLVDGGLVCTETVACLNRPRGSHGDLPRSYVQVLNEARYRFRSNVRPFESEDAFEAHVRSEILSFTADDNAVVGVFPGSPSAVTGIAVTSCDDKEVLWRTIHSYPQHRTVVETAGGLVLAQQTLAQEKLPA